MWLRPDRWSKNHIQAVFVSSSINVMAIFHRVKSFWQSGPNDPILVSYVFTILDLYLGSANPNYVTILTQGTHLPFLHITSLTMLRQQLSIWSKCLALENNLSCWSPSVVEYCIMVEHLAFTCNLIHMAFVIKK